MATWGDELRAAANAAASAALSKIDGVREQITPPVPPLPLLGAGSSTFQPLNNVIASATVNGYGVAKFTFPTVPTGYAFLGTFTPSIAQVTFPQQGSIPTYLGLGSLGNAEWQLSRNSNSEIMWTGYSLLTDFRAGPDETITITAGGLPTGAVINITWTGLIGQAPDVPFLAPRVEGVPSSVDTPVPAFLRTANIPPTQASTTTPDTIIIAEGAPGQILTLWDVTLSTTISSTSAHTWQPLIQAQNNAGVTPLLYQLYAAGSGAAVIDESQTTVTNFGGVTFSPASSTTSVGIALVIPAYAGTTAWAAATVVYSTL